MLAGIGFNINSALLLALVGVMGAILRTIINARAPLKKIAADREANLLSERADEMEKMRATIARLEKRLDTKDALHEAERAYDRHRINNLATSLNGFLMLVKANPEDAAKAAVMIEDLRARQNEEENKEAIALRALVARLAQEKPE